MNKGSGFIKGLVLKGIGGFYYVSDEEGKVFECKAAGRFRHENMSPLPGDEIEFSHENDNAYGFIENIAPRKNELIRPPVANISQLVITVSAQKPEPDLLMVDKLLVQAFVKNIKPLLLFNKKDVADFPKLEAITAQYMNVCEVFAVSAKTGENMESFKERLAGEVTCFAGQSAVGKSSVLNSVLPALDLKTGGLSKKTDRGKHTTRHVELLISGEFKGAVLDTPGFSMMEAEALEPQELQQYYPDFRPYLGTCRFATCIHGNEPDCTVKQAVKEGKIHAERYERYIKILQELKEKRLKMYD